MAQISPMFAVPMAFAQHPDPVELNRELRQLFLAREAHGARYANPRPYTVRNNALFESNFDLFDWPEAPVQSLRQFCLSELLRTVVELNQYDMERARRLQLSVDAWFHITRRDGFFAVHNHPMASWSGVYCVQPGAHDPGASDSGTLSFINPHSVSTMYLDPGNAHLKGLFDWSNHGFQLVPGQLVLFPSWLLHYVMPYRGDSERITVAFNVSFREAGGRG